jgi:hypothetical protein
MKHKKLKIEKFQMKIPIKSDWKSKSTSYRNQNVKLTVNGNIEQ